MILHTIDLPWNSYRCTIQRLRTPTVGELITDEDCYLWGREVCKEIDVSLIRTWMDTCSHGTESRDEDGSICHHVLFESHVLCKPEPMQPGVPSLLIDTHEKRLVEAPHHCQYAALSYVWGAPHVPQLKLNAETRSRLTVAGGLDATCWTDIPLTISDAIRLCELLSISYLWVDALCIEQSPSNPNPQLNYMSNIYGGAYLTIVGAAGMDSWAGLPGLQIHSRTIFQQKEYVNGKTYASIQPFAKDVLSSTVWASRGWTCQESLLSKRVLIFTDRQIFWSCNRDLFCEDFYLEKRHSNIFRTSTLSLIDDYRELNRSLGSLGDKSSYSQFLKYSELVKDYTSRSITYQDDALAACRGIFSLLSEKIETTFIHGMPVKFLEQTLIFDTRAFSPRFRRHGFPSWSWLGWNQELNDSKGVNFYTWEMIQTDGIYGPECFNAVESVCAWYSYDAKLECFSVIRDIKNKRAKEVADKNQSMQFRQLPVDINPQHVLICDTTSCTLKIYPHTPGKHQHSTPQQYAVYLSDGLDEQNPIGTLTLDPSWRRGIKDSIEFIAVAKGPVQTFAEEEEESRIFKAEYEDVIFALAIETDSNGISTRIQPLQIEQSLWLQAAPRQRTVYLA
jgi:hypothetical protein